MSILKYLQLQPVDPTNDGTVSPLDEYEKDETIDLDHDIDEQVLDESWDRILSDPEFSSEDKVSHK